MRWRLVAALAAFGIPAIALVRPEPLGGPWALPVVAACIAAQLVLVRGRPWGTWLLGILLAVMATYLAQDAGRQFAATGGRDSWPKHDLTAQPLPNSATGIVVLRGYLRAGWSLDEYQVAPGKRPDQNTSAERRLVPMLGTLDEEIPHVGRVVVARVGLSQQPGDKAIELAGELRPLDPELLASLVAFQAEVKDRDVRGILLDTTQLPSSNQAWTAVGVAGVTAFIAWILLGLTLQPRDAAPSDEEKPPPG